MILPDVVAYGMPIIFLAAFALILWSSARREKARREAYSAFAQQNGLSYEHLPVAGRTPPRHVFTEAASGLVLTVTRQRSTRRGRVTTTTGGTTSADFPDPTVQAGLVFYSAEMVPGMARAASNFLSLLNNRVGQRMIGRFLGEEYAPYLGGLVEQPVPPGLGLTILATADPAPLFDAGAVHRAVQALPSKRGAMVAITETGTRLRISRDLVTVEQIAAFLDAARSLQAGLKR